MIKIIRKTAISLAFIILLPQIGDSLHHALIHGHERSQTKTVYADSHCCTDLDHFVDQSKREGNDCPHCTIHSDISKSAQVIDERKELTYAAAIPAVYSSRINHFEKELSYNNFIYSNYSRLKQNISHTILLI